jgi:hypothetical protein
MHLFKLRRCVTEQNDILPLFILLYFLPNVLCSWERLWNRVCVCVSAVVCVIFCLCTTFLFRGHDIFHTVIGCRGGGDRSTRTRTCRIT